MKLDGLIIFFVIDIVIIVLFEFIDDLLCFIDLQHLIIIYVGILNKSFQTFQKSFGHIKKIKKCTRAGSFYQKITTQETERREFFLLKKFRVKRYSICTYKELQFCFLLIEFSH